ncbi:MAG: hypothetical protein R3Y08_09335 [Rikenellaceae bacterium]
MAQHTNKDSESNVVVSTLLVAVLASTAALLLLTAIVVWLADLVGSLCLSLLIVGSIVGIAAYYTYKIQLSPTLRRLREEYEMIAAIAKIIRSGCHKALTSILHLFE